jgi:hypothetical protein
METESKANPAKLAKIIANRAVTCPAPATRPVPAVVNDAVIVGS